MEGILYGLFLVAAICGAVLVAVVIDILLQTFWA